ncbi:MAG: FtsH protease activity modulator HflK [Planctomycetes bacterium]|nr:FtsH protease activity modulator HflK [Planctomycetota bacterium]
MTMDEFDWRKFTNARGRRLKPGQIFLLAWMAVAVIVVIWGVFTSFYTVEQNEEAVVLRFGAFHTVTGAGFHGKLPFGIDQVLKEEVKTVHRAEFGFRTVKAGVTSQFDYRSKKAVAEATMLTADLNLAMVTWEVRYKIRDIKNYLFKVREPQETLRDVSQAVMRVEVGDRSVDEVLTEGRTIIENDVAEKMQRVLDGFGCGIQVLKINLKHVGPPEAVRSAFNAVNQAIQVRDRIINEAEGERNKKVPAARGQKNRVIKEAEGYKVGRINRATGDTQAFLAVLEEYKKAEDITRRRLYLESMEKLLPKLDVTIIDGNQAGVLKVLDLMSGGKGKRP